MNQITPPEVYLVAYTIFQMVIWASGIMKGNPKPEEISTASWRAAGLFTTVILVLLVLSVMSVVRS